MRSENIETNELEGKTNYKVNFLLIAPQVTWEVQRVNHQVQQSYL